MASNVVVIVCSAPCRGEAYNGNLQVYVDGAGSVMRNLVEHLPSWIEVSI